MTHLSIPVEGGSLFCVESGRPEAPPLLFLHAFPFSHEMWTSQMEAVSGLCRALAYDIRGHGRSVVGDGQYTIEGHVDDLIAVLDHLKIEKTAVAGLSMGGYIALRALERNPDRFSAAILCDTRSEADTDEGKIKRAAAVRDVKSRGSLVFGEGLLKTLLATETYRQQPQTVEFCRRVIAENSPLAIAGTLLALASRTDTSSSLERLALPTLILVGECDVVTPLSSSQAMHRRIPGSELQIVPAAGHLSNLENPDAFNQFLLDFLRRVINRNRSGD